MDDMIYRQAAIDEIREDADWLESQGSDWQTERKERDFQILAGLPSVQPSFSQPHENDRSAEPCEDAVSRADMLNELDGWIEGFDANCHKESFADMKLVRSSMSKLPSVTPKPFHNITMREVLTYIDDMPEDVWQEFTACLECRGWLLERKVAQWCGSNFA